jgi:Putative adhesin
MSRASVVGMLIAAEVVIAGMAIYAVGHGGASFAAGMHRVDFTATPIAPVAAGASPHVVVDDAASRVRVAVSSDELVHVRDLTQIRGAVFSSAKYSQLQVTRTPDGVRIERPSTGSLSLDIFGFSTQKIEVEVPQGARVEIARCAGADVFGVAGGVSVHSLDGHVTLTDLQGAVDARSDDGYLNATNVRGDRLGLESMDGHLALQNVAVASLSGTTRDGRIEADGLNVTGDATLQTDDGPVRVRLTPDADLTIDASTRDGGISVDGNSLDRDDSAQRTIRLGAGTGRLKLDTADGSIHIFTNGAFQQ